MEIAVQTSLGPSRLVIDEAATPRAVLWLGHSAGARVACRTAVELGAVGVLCVSFPLHPPGKPVTSRLAELFQPRVPVLVLQGDRDDFGSAGAVRAEAAGHANITVIELTGADHGLKTVRHSGLDAAGLSAALVDAADAFVTATL